VRSACTNPEVLFLDEPHSGGIPWRGRQVFWSLINDFARRGLHLVTTHYLEERSSATALLMVAGEMLIEGSPEADQGCPAGSGAWSWLFAADQLQRATLLLLRRHLAVVGG